MSIFEMRKVNLTLTGVLPALAFVFTLGDGPIHAQGYMPGYNMPNCPIKATTIPPTTTTMKLPDENPVGEELALTGTVQVTDQTSSTVFKVTYGVGADDTGVVYQRTVNTLQHATGSLSFDHGCHTDPYGSNFCTWKWGDSITEKTPAAGLPAAVLQEDIQAGKLIVDLKVNNTTPVQFSMPICGATGNFTIPEQPNQNQQVQNPLQVTWVLMTQLFRFPLFLILPNYPHPFQEPCRQGEVCR
jgi:hypothetical protein